jgi:putative endopeptidase
MNNISTIRVVAALLLSLALLNSCKNKSDIKVANDPVYNNLDTTVKPGDDFFIYANNGWLKKHPIPAAYSGWGIGYLVVE